MSSKTDDDKRDPENDLDISILIWREKKIFSFFQNLISSKHSRIISCLAVDARCSFKSVSSNTLISASVSPVFSVNFETLVTLSLG